ncbi:SDR family NAD(P)-dependent oxidoreductase [Streptomyces ipomoeae]|uniref:SDR family NAD(P)-dependent oxidoreductase n=1 Tax=Streptomyces ipomoeae TaxID=103232 RepID=UPI0011465B50|nr:SDR family NAD(P)-dependent oxidoreductase [Streptomyces ipomoeae]MDX2931648.1 SDR family NAD(P)-dependent oxidoreductase [Streptomyces ipomoeae]TQE30632.1 SDR family NAD(P)-dependent oxidoreductase [Streptomyces ipomoeae]
MGLRNTRPIDIGSTHVIVTGGSSGIGLAAARLLAARGAKLSLIARGAERLETAAQEVSATVRRGPVAARRVSVAVRAADVADRSALTRAIVELEDEQARPCDVLITSAGLARPGHFLELPDDVFRQMIEVDHFGTLHAIRAVAPGMVRRGHGSVVAVSSSRRTWTRRSSPRRTSGSPRRPGWSAERSSPSRRSRWRRRSCGVSISGVS